MKNQLRAEYEKFCKVYRKENFHPDSFQMWLVVDKGYSRRTAQDLIDRLGDE